MALSWVSDLASKAASYALYHWARFADRGYGNDPSITKQLTQAGLNKLS